MALADFRQRPGALFGAAVVTHVILISAQVNTKAGLPVLQEVTFGAFSEIQRLTMAVVDGVGGAWTEYVALREVRDQNEALRQEVQTLRIRLQEERAVAQTTESLRQLLELRERTGLETTGADVIAGPASADFRTLTINKGSVDKVTPDMAVLSPSGVVGRVIQPVSLRAALVQLLIDRNAAAGALIERTRAQGVVVGFGNGELRMEYVPGTSDVNPGDLVVTSGIDGIYPKGFVIGTIDSVERGPGSYHEIVVRPAVDFSRLEEVLVVLTRPPDRPGEGEEGR
jgi:rod shape-determining protein MreC